MHILLVDPHEEVRATLSGRLLNDARVASVASIPCVEAAEGLLGSITPTVVLVDPSEHDSGWRACLTALVDLRARHAWFLIALHLSRQDDYDAGEAMQLGADLFLLKGLRTGDLLAAIIERLGGLEPV